MNLLLLETHRELEKFIFIAVFLAAAGGKCFKIHENIILIFLDRIKEISNGRLINRCVVYNFSLRFC